VAEVLICDWHPTGECDRFGKPYHRCANCGRGPWAFHRLAAKIGCGKRVKPAAGDAAIVPRGPVIIIDECTGCGEKSKAKRESKPVPVDYPGAE